MQWQQQLVGNKLYCSGRDVTDIKNQEKALLRRENQLTEAESIARMGHWHWTIGATEMEWSAELYRIFGVEEGEFKPTLESMNKMVHRGDISRLNQAFQRALIEENDYDMEFRIITKSGDTRFHPLRRPLRRRSFRRGLRPSTASCRT
jgi:two-component system cell cycle sensor histidine kinase PleC